MGLLQGTTMRIKKGTKTLFHETDASLSSTIDFKEVASKDTDGKLVTPGTQSWSLTANALVANDAGALQADLAELYNDHKNKILVTIEFSTQVSGDIIFSGSAYVETFNVQATNEEEVTGDFSFKGNGALAIGTVV